MDERIKITVTGPNTDYSPKVNGTFLQVDDFLRNGKYCFSKLEGKGQVNNIFPFSSSSSFCDFLTVFFSVA